MRTASAYKALCQEDKLLLQNTAQKVAMLVDKPEKMTYYREQLTVFADKWTAYETAKKAKRKGKWLPSMGRPGNPLGTIWYGYGSGWSDDIARRSGVFSLPSQPQDVPRVLGAFALLAIIQDKVLPNCPSIAKNVLTKQLVNRIWRILVTGETLSGSGPDTGSDLPRKRRVIPVIMLEKILGGVEVDIENRFAPPNTPRKIHPHFPEEKADLQEPVNTGTKIDNSKPAGQTKDKVKPKKKGRQPDTDFKADQRIYEAWGTGHHTNYESLGRELGISKKDVTRAIDRHRKRINK